MRILVAGGAGYVGSALIPVLLEHGYKVDVIDLMWFGNHLPQEVRVLHKDLFSCTEEDLADYEQIIFLAGLSNDPMAEYDPSKNFVFNFSIPRSSPSDRDSTFSFRCPSMRGVRNRSTEPIPSPRRPATRPVSPWW